MKSVASAAQSALAAQRRKLIRLELVHMLVLLQLKCFRSDEDCCGDNRITFNEKKKKKKKRPKEKSTKNKLTACEELLQKH
jgi:hypothetical protein